jgi:FtsP/CotA-like multicopper oxidase with cupredoxin domain
MRIPFQSLIAIPLFLGCALAGSALAQTPSQPCPVRPLPGTVVQNPPSLSSQNGVLQAAFALRKFLDGRGYEHYCYDYVGTELPGFVESPTLRLTPGDQLILDLKNDLPKLTDKEMAAEMPGMDVPPPAGGSPDCQGGKMTESSTNMHFHGLNIPPTCHQDDVINTLIQPGDPPFRFQFTVPPNDPPGLYWYHPHPHGYTTNQVNGGAAGALIIEGMEKLRPEVSGLKERVLVIREQVLNPNAWIPGPYEMSINYQLAVTPAAKPPIIEIKPHEKQFWRVANASTQLFLALQLQYSTIPQKMLLIAVDGVPLKTPQSITTIRLAPAGRVEFVMEGPDSGQDAQFDTLAVNTGPVGNPNVAQVIADIATTDNPQDNLPTMPAVAGTTGPQRFAELLEQPVTTERRLYFSETAGGTNGPTKYMVTVEGQKPHVYEGSDPPAIKTQIGAVEDWTIENHAQEEHAFHIHQIHFMVMEINGKPLANPYLSDTVEVPFWSGSGPFPSVKVRMDFRDPNIAGTFVYHCHVLDHEDGGMMAKIEVDPAN